jgi:hypothetical protein
LKVVSIVGARPQFIKAVPAGKALRAAGHTKVLGFHYHQYTIRAPQRDDLAAYLKERGIGTMVYYPVPLHLQELYADLGYGEGSLPASEAASREVLSLPMYPELTEARQVMVAEAIRGFYEFGIPVCTVAPPHLCPVGGRLRPSRLADRAVLMRIEEVLPALWNTNYSEGWPHRAIIPQGWPSSKCFSGLTICESNVRLD